jgi:hypothetical protein
MTIRLLRGQVAIRENLRAQYSQFKHIIVPDRSTKHDKDAIQYDRTSHRGIVLGMGAPALTPNGVEIDPGFGVGDEVIFHFAHLEKAWTAVWEDGERAVWIPQMFIDAVVIPDEVLQ